MIFLLAIIKCQKGAMAVFKNRNQDGTLNISGIRIAALRKALRPKVSQRALAEKLQLEGVDLDKNAIQLIESGKRFVTDIELKALAKVLKVSADDLLK